MKKLFALVFLCLIFSTANAVIIGVSPASKEVDIYSGETENIKFAFSTNESSEFIVNCVTEEDSYLFCPGYLNVGYGITYFNVTVNAPYVSEPETINDTFKICYAEESANVISCVQAEVIINVIPKGISMFYPTLALLIIVGVVMIIYAKTHKFETRRKLKANQRAKNNF